MYLEVNIPGINTTAGEQSSLRDETPGGILSQRHEWKHSPKNLSEADAVLTGICVFGQLEFRPSRGFYPVVSCPAFYNPAMRG